MRPVKLFSAVAFLVVCTLGSGRAQQVATTSDPYITWAKSQWGTLVVNDPSKEATVWGQSADPDGDGLSNLQEYAFGTDARQPGTNPVGRDFGTTTPGYLTLNYTQRADDASLVIFPQYSSDMQNWWPLPPRDAFSWQGDGRYFWSMQTGPVANGLQSVTRVCAQPLSSSPSAFSRVLVLRNGTMAIGTPLDAVQFFDSVSGASSGSVDSNSVVLSGFAGTVAVSVSSGAHLIVNGVDVGASANVAAGSTLRIRATSPIASGETASYTLSIGGVTRTWNVVTRPPVPPSLTPPSGTSSLAGTSGLKGASAGAAAVTAPGVSSTPSGYTPVSASVGEGGAANISIPITVSPGTGGMEPKLAITYSSQGGNGILGMGFGISGLSAVGRAGPVSYLDGIKGGVTFGANDRFTVDGQRLVLASGTWGGDGAEYRTENESFSKITSNALPSAPLGYWEMKSKAGLTYNWGTSRDSRIMANRSNVPGDTAILAWALEAITDVTGSRLTFVYAQPSSTDYGYPRIVSIFYTQHLPDYAPGQEVAFFYEDRPDVRTSYIGGAKVIMGKRLTAIECRQGGKIARRYEFAYQQAETSGNSQLIAVTEKGKKPTNSGDVWQAFPPTTFTWHQDAAANMNIVTSSQSPALAQMKFSRSPPSLTIQGDFDGNGCMDLMDIRDSVPSFWLASGQTSGGFAFKSGLGGFQAGDQADTDGNDQLSIARSGDFDGDGKTDALQMGRSGTGNWVALSQGNNNFNVRRKQAQIGDLYGVGQTADYTSQVLTMDFNGDGRTDILVLYATKAPVVLLSNGDGSFKKTNPGAVVNAIRITDGRPAYQWVLPGDYNGDGLGDILFLYRNEAGTTNHSLLLSKGDGTFDLRNDAQLGGLHNQGFALSYAYIVSGDFNGDGLTDVYNVDEHGDAWISYAKGDATFETTAHPATLQGYEGSGNGPPYSQFLSGDFNGDGFTDIFHACYVAASGFLAFSQGSGAFSVLTNGQMGVLDNHSYAVGNPPSRLFVGDFDGDGHEDVMHMNYGASGNFLARSSAFNADRVVQVTSGHGGYTKFNYKPLTDPSVYTKGTGTVYPYYDVTGGMYVVASTVARNAVDGDAFTVQANPGIVESTTTYAYERAWALLDGHGYQGFAAVQSKNLDSGITSRTEYFTSDPHLSGHPTRQVQSLSDGTVISETINSWTSRVTTLPGGSKTYFPYTTQSVTKAYEINNGKGAAPIKITTVSGQTYDDHGNLTHSLTDYGGGFKEETTSLYTNDTSPEHWWLGRLYDTVVVQTSPGPITASRHSTFEYSPTNGQLTKEILVTPASESNLRLEKTYKHDLFGNIYESTLKDLATGETRTTHTDYTPDGRFVYKTTNALGQEETKTFDALDGTVLTQTGPNGLTTTWTYDGFGRPLTETRPDGTRTFTWYMLCAPGNGVPPRAAHCVFTQSSGSGLSAVYFDLLDRQIRQDATGFDGRTVSSHAIFNVKGEAINSSLPYFSSSSTPTAPLSQYTVNHHDAIGRVFQQDVPGAETESGPRITATVYTGLTATVTNPKNQTFQTTTDPRGRTTSSTSFGTDTVTNTHDPYGNLTQVDDNKGHQTTMVYDGRSNKIRMTEPNSGTTRYGYNAFGELISQTDALNRVTTISYDALGRMVRRMEPNAPGIYNGLPATGPPIQTDWVYEFGPDGKVNPNGAGKLGYVWRRSDGYLESYRYDGFGRLTETLTQVGAMRFVSSTTFDEYGRSDTISYPTSFAVHNHYNDYGHLDYVNDAAIPMLKYWTATSVNARGQVIQEQFGNGLSTRRGYDNPTGLLQSIQTGTGNGTGFAASVQNLGYNFDKLNNLTERKDFGRGITENFSYDTTNQLSGNTCSASAAVTISCDHLGNIVSRNDVGTYTYGERGAGPHAVTSIVGVNGQPSRTLNYNIVGNCVQDGTTTLEYNAANQPVAIQASAGTILFSYTPSRARLKRTDFANGSLNERVYIGSLYERNDGPGGIVHTHFIPAGSGVVAIHTRTQTMAGTTSQTRYVHKDHLGSIHTLTRENGSIDEVLFFDAWGRRRTLSFDQTTQSLRYNYGNVMSQTDRGFTGHEMLDAVDLIHMNGRIYDPTIGRFLSVDPVVQEMGNLQSLNRYCYVLNNPLSLTDPSGFFSIGKFFKKYWKPIVAAAVGIATGGAAMAAIYGLDGILAGSTAFLTGSLAAGASVSTGAAIVAGAAAGFGSAFTGTLLGGGSLGDAFRAGAIGGAWGGASAGVFQKIDVNLPDWMHTRPLPNETMITSERLFGQAERIFVRGAASDGIAHLQGKRGHTAFWRSVAFDSASLAQDALNEAEWREEWSLPNHGGHKNWNAIEEANQGFATAQEPAEWKPAYKIAVYNFRAKNFGKPWGQITGCTPNFCDLSQLSAFSEGGSQFTRIAADMPVFHQVSIYHDMFITMAERLVTNQSARSVANWGSMIPYAGFVYGKYNHEQQLRTGQIK